MLYTAMYANLGLVLAATNKKRRAINVLKTSKADIPETPLHDACESGHTDAVRKLLRRGALVDAKDKVISYCTNICIYICLSDFLYYMYALGWTHSSAHSMCEWSHGCNSSVIGPRGFDRCEG